jgi:hypothetical protein
MNSVEHGLSLEQLMRLQADAQALLKQIDEIVRARLRATPSTQFCTPPIPRRRGAERRLAENWMRLPPVFTLDVARSLGQENTKVRRSRAAYYHPIKKLVRAGVLEEVPGSGPNPTTYRKRLLSNLAEPVSEKE